MSAPGSSPVWASVQLPTAAECGGVTELRVHGVGVTPRAAINGDPAPEQASGDRLAGFYRIAPHRASAEDQDTNQDVDRHVEVYASSGLNFSSKSRVLWLALLPFLLSNMAGWMCSVRTRQSRWWFRLHRLAYGLGALALTVNAFLVTVMITVDILAYQTSRAGLARHRWWSAPLSWHFVAGHPARQVMLGTVVPVLLLLVISGLAGRSWRYEAVRPRLRGQSSAPPRTATAAVLDGGLADSEFWDGVNSVRLLTWVHVAVVAGFLGIVLGVTANALTATGSAHVIALGWIAIGLGAATVALGVGYICMDALGTSPINVPSGAAPADCPPAGSALADKLRGWAPSLLVPAFAALIVSGEFAWLQPGGPGGRAAELPGMASVIRWTTLAIAVPVAAALVSMLLGLSRGGRRAILRL
jgi:hypothetical protein